MRGAESPFGLSASARAPLRERVAAASRRLHWHVLAGVGYVHGRMGGRRTTTITLHVGRAK